MTIVTVISKPSTVTVTNRPTSVTVKTAAPVRVHIAKAGVQGRPGEGTAIDPNLVLIYNIAKET